MGLRLKAGTSGTGTVRESKSIEFKVAILVDIAGGTSPRDALQAQCEEFGYTFNNGMDKHPHSIIWQYRKSVQRAVEAGNESVIEALRDADLIEDDGVENDNTDSTEIENVGESNDEIDFDAEE